MTFTEMVKVGIGVFLGGGEWVVLGVDEFYFGHKCSKWGYQWVSEMSTLKI